MNIKIVLEQDGDRISVFKEEKFFGNQTHRVFIGNITEESRGNKKVYSIQKYLTRFEFPTKRQAIASLTRFL